MSTAWSSLWQATPAVMQEYYQRCRDAEEHRAEEQQAAVVLQARWRGCLQRQELERLTCIAIVIQKCWRGYLGRRKYAAALALRNTQLRQAYFNHHATVIQKCWRGFYSRHHIHDFYKRKAFLQSVAAANAAVKAAMQQELQEGLRHQQREAQAAAQQYFDSQVGRLHYLSSTASIPGIFSPPTTAAAAAGSGQPAPPYTVAGRLVEQHLRAAAKHKATAAVKQQQVALQRALEEGQRCTSPVPAGPLPHGCKPGRMPGTAPRRVAAARPLPAAGASAPRAPAGACDCSSARDAQPASWSASPESCCCASAPNQHHPHGSSGRDGTGSTWWPNKQDRPQSHQKLAHRLAEQHVSCVYAAKAEPNMPDGSFNPGLSLQQALNYEAAREAADLERRLDRGLMLALHQGKPFISLQASRQHAVQSSSWKAI